MIEKKFQPNLLNLFDLRRLNHYPPHFYAVDFDLSTNEKVISDWIWLHLSGRFYLGDIFIKNESGNKTFRKRAAFEIHGEGTLFAINLNDLNKFSSQS